MLCAISISSFAKEPTNFDIQLKKLTQYNDSGEYQRDQANVINEAKNYLQMRLQKPNKKPLAIVLDIDETSLSNYPDMVSMRFGGTYEQIIEAENRGKDPVIQPTLELYNFAKANKVAVFFVTGRTEDSRTSTEKNLTEAGFKNWDGLILKPLSYGQHKSPIQYKTNARAEIEKKGYEIVLNIGDQKSDLMGGHAEKGFKMPNPYYLIQ